MVARGVVAAGSADPLPLLGLLLVFAFARNAWQSEAFVRSLRVRLVCMCAQVEDTPIQSALQRSVLGMLQLSVGI